MKKYLKPIVNTIELQSIEAIAKPALIIDGSMVDSVASAAEGSKITYDLSTITAFTEKSVISG